MAIWSNADWEQETTTAAQRTKLIAFRAELQDAVTLGVSGNGHSVNATDVRELLKMTNDWLARLDATLGAAGNRPVLVSTRTRTARRAPPEVI